MNKKWLQPSEEFLIFVVRLKEKTQKVYNEEDNLTHKAIQKSTLLSHQITL